MGEAKVVERRGRRILHTEGTGCKKALKKSMDNSRKESKPKKPIRVSGRVLQDEAGEASE